MSLRLTFRPSARRDLEGIWDLGRARWGVTQAEDYVRRIKNTLDLLTCHPEMGRSCEDIRAGYRKRPVGVHVVFYRLTGDTIEVVRILHQRMDVDSRLD